MVQEQKKESKNRFLTIDIMKGIAIWLVIATHSIQKFSDLNPLFDILKVGQMGCQTFFVISGISSMLSISRMKVSGKPLFAWQFYKKRIKSIVPGWYIAIFTAYLLNSASLALWDKTIGFAFNRTPYAILGNLLLLQGLLPFCNNDVYAGGWYIGTLVIMYLAAPIIYICMRRFSLFLIRCMPFFTELCACVFIIGAYIKTQNADLLANNHFMYFSFINQMGCFMIGVSMYFEMEMGSQKKSIKFSGWMSLLYLLVCIYLFFSGWKYTFVIIPFIMGLFTYHFMICMMIMEKEDRTVFTNSKLVTVISKYGQNSYYIYLVHALFVWSMPYAVIDVLNFMDLEMNDTVLYCILIVPMFVLSYYLGKCFQIFVNTILTKLGR